VKLVWLRTDGTELSCAGSNGNYLLHPVNNPALCLDVRNAGATADTVVIGWDCNGHQ
jgi:hypothetical protein